MLFYLCALKRSILNLWPVPGMGKIEKVGDLESQNLSIKNCLRNTGIDKSTIGLVKISPFSMKKFEINKTNTIRDIFPMICF